MLQHPAQCVVLALRVLMQQAITSILLQLQDGSAGAQPLSVLAYDFDTQSKNRSKLLNGADLNPIDRNTVVACVLLSMHFRDTLHSLCSSGCAAVHDFAWLSTIRMVWQQQGANSSSNCVAKLLDLEVPYGFDVSPGDCAHVTTLQTTRFNLGVVSALQSLCCCHALYGPSGCGKSSLMQNLAGFLGRSFISADTQECVTVDRLPLLMTAAASASIWIALDHVHTWPTELLSCFSQTLLSILAHIRRQGPSANTSNDTTLVMQSDAACGGVLIFITASDTFARHSSSVIGSAVSLNFRPSHVATPDVLAVAEAFFVVQGFDSAGDIAKKMHYLVTEWSSLLPAPCPQLSTKHISEIASCARRIAGSVQVSHDREAECVGAAVRLIALSRCPPELLDIIEPMVQLLYPPVVIAATPQQQWPLQTDVIKSAFGMAQLTWSHSMSTAASQLCSTIQVSTGVIVVGSCCSGKSSLIAVASELRSSQKPIVEMTSIDPVCCFDQLFSFRASNGVVLDGMLNSIFNGSSDFGGDLTCKWLHCDGNISCVAEALLLHSHLKRVLQSDPSVCFDRIVFETDNLNEAPPSIVAQMSIVYCPPGMLQHKIFLEDLVKCLKFSNKTTQQQVSELFLALLPKTLALLFPEGCGSVDAEWLRQRQLMVNVVQLISCMFTSDACEMLPSACAKLFTFCLFWGLAGATDRCIWDQSSSCYLEWGKSLEILGSYVRSVCSTSVMLPPKGVVEDLHEYSVSANGDWCRWDTVLADPLPLIDSSAVYVQNSLTAPCLHILTNLMVRGHHAAITGCRGSGKNALVSALTAKLAALSPSLMSSSSAFSVVSFRSLSCDYAAAASDLQVFLRNQLQLSDAGVYAPAAAATLVVVVDDLSVCPQAARPSLNAALRQCFGSAPVGSRSALGGLYDQNKCGLLRRITGTCVLVKASKLDLISPRTARYLVPVHLATPSEAQLTRLFETVAASAFSTCALDVRSYMVKLAAVTVSVYHQSLRLTASHAAVFSLLPHPSDCLKVIESCAVSGSVNAGSSKALQRVWLHEMCRVFRDRFGIIGFVDFDRMFKTACSSLLEVQVTDANISQLWTKFHSLDNTLYTPVSSMELVIDLLRARLSEYHKKHKERLSLVLDCTSITAIAFVARVLQQSYCHCALLDHEHTSSRAFCFFSCYIADFGVIEVPALDSAASGVSFLRAAAVQCVEGNIRLAVIIREETLDFDRVLELVAALVHGEASGIFERDDLLRLARKVPEMLPVSGASSLHHIHKFVSEALQRNLRVILLGSSSPSSPITKLPHIASKFAFHTYVQPQSTFFFSALQETFGSGFGDFTVGGIQSQGIADAFSALRDAVLVEADRAHLSSAVKQKLAGGDCCLCVVQVFCTDISRRIETHANSITLTQNSISAYAALKADAEELKSRIQQLQQQIDHSRILQQDIAVTCRELQAATACPGRPPLDASKVRIQLLSFADHLLVDCLSGSRVSFAESFGEALLVALDATEDENYGLPEENFKGNQALTRIKDSLKSKGCTPQSDSLSSSWILEGISRHAKVKQESIVRLHTILARSGLQNIYNSSSGTIDDIMDDFDKCMLELLVSLHNTAREEQLHKSEDALSAAVQQEIDLRNTLDESAAVHASLAKLCDALQRLQEKWKVDVEVLQLQQSRMVGDTLQTAVQLVWGVLFSPEHREVLVKRSSECLSIHGIDSTNSILELGFGFMPHAFDVYEAIAMSTLVHKDLGLAWTVFCDPDQRLLPALQQHVQSKGGGERMSSVRTDDLLFTDTLERCINDGHLLAVHVVEPSVPGVLLDLVRTRSLRIFGRFYVRIGSRMIEMHRNFTLVLQLSLLRFDDVPELLSACRAVDLTLHVDSLVQHLAAAMVFGKQSSTEQSQVSSTSAVSAHNAVSKCETLIMKTISNPSMRSISLAFELLESAHALLAEHLVLETEFKQRNDQLAQSALALELNKDVAKAVACMHRNLRAMRLIDHEAGVTTPMLLDIFFLITQSLKYTVVDSSPVLFNILSQRMASTPRSMFALLFACSQDPHFSAPELTFLHLPIGLKVSPAIDGYEFPNTRELEWLPLDVWARVTAFTSLPGVGVDVLKSLRTRSDAWKKWYLSIDKGVVEQFPDGFSKKLTPIQCACLARCFSENLLQPTLQLYVAKTLGVIYDESRFDSNWFARADIRVPVVVNEGNGLNALSAVEEMRELVHGDRSVCCVVADGSSWPKLVSNVSNYLTAGHWVAVCCMVPLPWESFQQLFQSAAKCNNSRLFIVCSASGSIPRDACAMCLLMNAPLSSSPSAFFNTIYQSILSSSSPHNTSGMSVSQAYKQLASSRQAAFQLACSMVLARQHDALVDMSHTQDMSNTNFLKMLGARCASASSAMFRHLREFPVPNLPKGYTYATVDDIVAECLKELSDWFPSSCVSRFMFSLPTTLGSSIPNIVLQEQGGSDIVEHMTTFAWPRSLHQLKVDISLFIRKQGCESRQLQAGLQLIPCMYPYRSIPLIPFDSAQIHLMLDLLPSESELHHLLRRCDHVSAVDTIASCVSMVSSLSMFHVCHLIQQVRALLQNAEGYNLGLVSSFEMSSNTSNVASICSIVPAFSLFTCVGIQSLHSAIRERIIPRYQALKSASACSASGVPLGAFYVPYRLLSAARTLAARTRSIPIQSLRIKASVVTGLDKLGHPILAVCDVFARNAIFTTTKANDCDTVIFSSQSFQPSPIAFLFTFDSADGHANPDASSGGVKRAKVPLMLQSVAPSEDTLNRAIALVGKDVLSHSLLQIRSALGFYCYGCVLTFASDICLDGVDPAQLTAENVYLAAREY